MASSFWKDHVPFPYRHRLTSTGVIVRINKEICNRHPKNLPELTICIFLLFVMLQRTQLEEQEETTEKMTSKNTDLLNELEMSNKEKASLNSDLGDIKLQVSGMLLLT